VESRKSDGSPDSNPAAGYEISEDGKSLAAVQDMTAMKWYEGVPRQFVYIRRDLEPRMKLILAAAMTVILQGDISLSGEDF
jgi:hypothetical protein